MPVPVFVNETGWEYALPTKVEGNVRLVALGERR